MKLTTKQLTLCAVLTALALALSYLENFFPLSLAIPIPGIKLGLANIVTVFALYALGPGQALLILAGRCLLGAVFALIVAAAFGCLHGVFVHYFRMPSFLVTLSSQYILFGAGQLVTGSKILMCTKPDFILTLGNGNLFGIATPVYVFAVIAIVLYLLLNKTVFGRKVFAVGGNKSASALCGICVPRITILAYIVSSVCACLAGILLSAINQQATPAAGNGYEGEVLLCIVMGGTIMGTGIGSMGGALYGTLFIGLLNNGMRLLGIPSHYQTLIKGSLIVIAVAIDVYSNNRAATAGFYRKKENVENKGGTQSGND